MLVTMKEILDRASTGNYAVIAPNVFCEIDTRAAIAAAEKILLSPAATWWTSRNKPQFLLR